MRNTLGRVILAFCLVCPFRTWGSEKVLRHDDGSLKARYGFIDGGTLHGSYEVYYPNGQLKWKGWYRNGSKTGVWCQLSERGDTLSVTDYGDGSGSPRALWKGSGHCNPPCPVGTYCHRGVNCVPKDSNPPRPVRKTYGPCLSNADCAKGYICFRNDCEDIPTIESAGNVAHTVTSVFGFAATLAGAIAPIALSRSAYHTAHDEQADDDGYYSSSAGPVSILSSTIPVAAFGGLNRIGLGKQSQYLRYVGSKPEARWVALSWASYAATYLSSLVCGTSYSSDNQTYATSAAVVNAAVLAATYVLNQIAFYKQFVKLGDVLYHRQRGRVGRSPAFRLTCTPYSVVDSRKAEAGLVVAIRPNNHGMSR